MNLLSKKKCMHEKIENGGKAKSEVNFEKVRKWKPSFTKIPCIEKKVESKIKKSLLLKFFENEKMTKKKILKKYRKKKNGHFLKFEKSW